MSHVIQAEAPHKVIKISCVRFFGISGPMLCFTALSTRWCVSCYYCITMCICYMLHCSCNTLIHTICSIKWGGFCFCTWNDALITSSSILSAVTLPTNQSGSFDHRLHLIEFLCPVQKKGVMLELEDAWSLNCNSSPISVSECWFFLSIIIVSFNALIVHTKQRHLILMHDGR